MDLWVTSSSEEEEEEETTPPPKIKKSTKIKSAPPKSITRTTKVKPSKRVTRRNDIEDDDEEEGKSSGPEVQGFQLELVRLLPRNFKNCPSSTHSFRKIRNFTSFLFR